MKIRPWMIGIGISLTVALPLVYSAIVVPLSPGEQAQVSLALIALAVLASLSRRMRPLIIFLSSFASMRYFYWRINSTVNFDTRSDAFVSLLLLGAEIYGLLVLFLGYFQTIEKSERHPPPVKNHPSVDVFIPTYNEPAEIVRRTLIGALAIEYPRKKIYILDDGRRSEIEALSRGMGAYYVARSENRHAKAGNLNHALSLTESDLIAVFDADHIPVSGFLSRTVGFFEDPGVALVQTAQHFFNPDPFERNLNLLGKVAPEQDFFYHVIQPGNDWWNSAFFCGSCAVLRRSALEAIGGFKTETVTEDAHTSLELHSRGYRSVYLPMALAAGLATENLAAHVRQRMRWARGMAQILRIDCPLFKRGLSLPQRLNYLNAMLHFFFGLPRLVMIAAPLSYLFFGVHPIRADVLSVIAYILPHIGLSTIANSIISRSFRHSFWAAVYEVSIAPYTAGVTLLALVNPRLGKFNVTDKGTNLDRARFDWRISKVTLGLLGISLIGLLVAFPIRLLLSEAQGSEPFELDSILINSLWALANLLTLLAAACVAFEQPQERNAPRVRRDFRCEIIFQSGSVAGRTIDLSESGVRVRVSDASSMPEECMIRISNETGIESNTRARRVRGEAGFQGNLEFAFSFVEPDATSVEKIVRLLFSGDNSWTERSYPRDNVLLSFWHLLTTVWRVAEPRAPRGARPAQLEEPWRTQYLKQEG